MAKIKLECETDYHKAAQDYLKEQDYTSIYLLHQSLVGIKYALPELKTDNGRSTVSYGICYNVEAQLQWRVPQCPDYFSLRNKDNAIDILRVLMRIWLASKLSIKNLDCNIVHCCYPVEVATINAGIRTVTSRSNRNKLHRECSQFHRSVSLAGELWLNCFRLELLDFLTNMTMYYRPSWDPMLDQPRQRKVTAAAGIIKQ